MAKAGKKRSALINYFIKIYYFLKWSCP